MQLHHNIPNPKLKDQIYDGLMVPKIEKVTFIDNEDRGFDLERVNKAITRYYQFSEFIINWYHVLSGREKWSTFLLPLSWIPSIRRKRRKLKEILPPDMMSTGDIGIYVDLNHNMAVVDSQKMITNYPKFEQLFLKYKEEYEKMKNLHY